MDVITPHTLPQVHTLPSREFRGAFSLSDEVPKMDASGFLEAFRNHYDTDSHFIAYRLSTGEEMPRLNKPVLPFIRNAGQDVLGTMIILDYDNPGHLPWAPGQTDQFLAKLAEATDNGFAIAMNWTLCYTTRNGARLVYVLSRSIPVQELEAKHAALCREFNQQGIAIDTTVSDWTRLFRLPFVMRDGKPTWEDSPLTSIYCEQIENITDPATLSSDPIKKIDAAAKVVEYYNGQKPTPDMARQHREVFNTESGRVVQSEFYKKAKHRLKGRECYGCVFKDEDLSLPGRRDATIHQFTGQAIGLLFHLEESSPDHIYSLFLPAVEQLEADDETPDWTDVLWDHICRLWGKESAKHDEVMRVETLKSEEAVALIDQIIEGMRQWCQHPDLRSADKHTRIKYAERHLICSVDKYFYLMGKDGFYNHMPVSGTQLIAAIRTAGMGDVIRTSAQTEQGVKTDRQTSAIVAEYATIVGSAEATPGRTGAEIANIDSPNALFLMPCFSRNTDLDPEYNPLVDEWLTMLEGDRPGVLKQWIGWALAFDDGPVCALSIMGHPGAGKKMLVHGLSECLTVPALATAADLVGGYQYGLLSSPFLSVDEGWPKTHSGRHPADEFRSMVSGDLVKADRKFFAPTKLTSPVRIIFTANNHNLVKMLTHGRELSPEDRDAIAIRLLHINVGNRASQWFVQKGGVAMTGQDGKRWIRGDGSAKSNFIVAKHFLWLWKTRFERGKPGGRFLMEGQADQNVMFEMRTGGGSGPLVIEAILKMLENATGNFPGLAVVNNRIFALASSILDFYRPNMLSHGGKITVDMVSNVLKGLQIPGAPDLFVLKSREYMKVRRWVEISGQVLLMVAQKDGWGSKKLEEIVKKQLTVGIDGDIVGVSE